MWNSMARYPPPERHNAIPGAASSVAGSVGMVRTGQAARGAPGVSPSGVVIVGDGDGNARVDGEYLAGHPARLVAGQIDGRPANVPRAALVFDQPGRRATLAAGLVQALGN